jgi:hypothetical protein
MISGVLAIPDIYGTRMMYASLNTSTVFARNHMIGDAADMLTAAEILAELDRRGVQRSKVAKVLGVAQPNATRLYVPDPRSKSQETRALTWDEGRILIEEFGLAQEEDAPEPFHLNEDLLRPIVAQIASVARRAPAEDALQPLTTALARYLQQLDTRPSIHSNPDALEAVAQSVSPQAPRSKH